MSVMAQELAFKIRARRFISSIIHFLWMLRYRLIYLLRGKVVGARALVIRDNEVLLIRHTYNEGWYTIGGEVDKTELPLDAVKREIGEEAGVKALKDPELMGVYHTTFGKRDDYIFFYIVKEFDLVDSSSPEIEECRWFPFDNLPMDISPSTKRRIDEYHQRSLITGKW